ncbi:MAG: 5'/3'-nucleotidase SurE [Myxococcota bacterium]
MRILVSNDDGIDAPGLGALVEQLSRAHDVWVVAPADEQSAKSHSLTMHVPLRAIPRGPQRWAVTGTPADCIYVAVHHLLVENLPDLVVSGINHGGNIGTDVHYSGTVAAAREASLQGFQAVAISLQRLQRGDPNHWDTACGVAERVVNGIAAAPMPGRVFLNVNVPSVAPGELRGIKACRLGDRIYGPLVDARIDPRGRPYLWIGGPHLNYGPDPDADGPSVEAGWATVTPLSAHLTSEADLPRIRAWTDA